MTDVFVVFFLVVLMRLRLRLFRSELASLYASLAELFTFSFEIDNQIGLHFTRHFTVQTACNFLNLNNYLQLYDFSTVVT
jgi:hypothetical protein